jgi:preprotein translocase subunit SecB
LAQFTRDLSFENPNAPRSFQPQPKPPSLAMEVKVDAKQMAETDYEVNVLLEGAVGEGAETLFKFELDYVGIFRLQNIPTHELRPILMIECPRLLFPFARQIIADAVRNGGFPQFFLDPIDFVALYRKGLAEMPPASQAAN